MQSNPLYALISGRIFYGWAIVATGFVAMFVSGAGQSHTFSVFLEPVSSELGLSHTEWSSAYGIATLAAAFGLPHMGRLTDRYGPKRMLLIVAVLLGIACLCFGALSGFLALGVVFAVLRFLGQGSVMLNASNLVSRWFDVRRGFALSLMALGFSLSMALHPPLAQWLIELVGWREAWIWMGVSTWLLLLPVVWLLAINRPSDVGDHADGVVRTDARGPAGSAMRGLTRHQALRTSAFYIICGGLLSLSGLVTALHLFQVAIFTSHGLDSAVAARVFPVSAITMVVCVPVIGKLLDRAPTHWMFAFGQLVMMGSLFAASQVTSIGTALVYALVFGLNNAVTLTLFSFVWPRFFGLAHLGSIQGLGQMIGVVGASLGALPLGLAWDRLGSYDETLMALMLLPAVCVVLAFFLRPPVDQLNDGEAQSGA
ncbi:MAG: MFS transporter [Pseudomonadota bacterium]